MGMRLYSAILLTIALMFWPVPIAFADETLFDRFTDGYFKILVPVTALWAGVTTGSFGWGLFVLLLWPLGFPSFLLKTPALSVSPESRPNSQAGSADFTEAYGGQPLDELGPDPPIS